MGTDENDEFLIEDLDPNGSKTIIVKLFHGDDSISFEEDLAVARVLGGSGNDSIFGTEFDDRLNGNNGNDDVFGGNGDDTIIGGRDDDVLRGEAGDDLIRGGQGSDRLLGGDGDDRLFGGGGDDFLDGGVGDDTLKGGSGNDTIRANDGDDVAEGGQGNDVFHLDDHDGFVVGTTFTIRDFKPGQDKIDLTDLHVNGGATMEALDTNTNGMLEKYDAQVSMQGGFLVIDLGDQAGGTLLVQGHDHLSNTDILFAS
ncbi:MAG: hypothetical protein KIT00_00190 [Rhodospirillales bacterium]|nr:hypothetical protein [Rhodospirillales bacterium]